MITSVMPHVVFFKDLSNSSARSEMVMDALQKSNSLQDHARYNRRLNQL
ncbi:hypothetical protein PF005_g2813 [Phytophthora fragariae]|uniref:Uncharacterized protein n=2 Tax=Phytophthora TaxID=4783 RepID=A0A6A3UP68_9STRA|nr:hypothetical protein PF003_g4844 [Phytophthora fragariae]KAE9040367.1 hypothetical protein PR002_g5000 [Phytophthora rubi]KAE8947252.1 hypothetical protein PF009_g3125 [Phytophthora fragariae]KAE9007751.1 hypothetical protein PF011_g10991 [Phytophthora fragariae]KAE9050551.1 hypothetical protein PR001_g2280 [Phytophthora rubi]